MAKIINAVSVIVKKSGNSLNIVEPKKSTCETGVVNGYKDFEKPGNKIIKFKLPKTDRYVVTYSLNKRGKYLVIMKHCSRFNRSIVSVKDADGAYQYTCFMARKFVGQRVTRECKPLYKGKDY